MQYSCQLFFSSLSPCAPALAPPLFFIKPISGVQAHCWMRRDFRYFYSCIFHNVLSWPGALIRVIKLRDIVPGEPSTIGPYCQAQLFIWDFI